MEKVGLRLWLWFFLELYFAGSWISSALMTRLGSEFLIKLYFGSLLSTNGQLVEASSGDLGVNEAVSSFLLSAGGG